ncbi:MAG: hypothetical protein A2Z12_09500 [Actinobacteria bacterium RBG_16_68_21]|nr:MAG: hypothetical protein A2Z12_09500 [Actinobacteria bacterium RBG_16_68_21]
MIVADASVVVDLLLGPGSEAGDTLAALLAHREVVCAPHLVDAEVGQALRRLAAMGDLSGTGATQMVRDLADVPILRYPHAGLLQRAFEFRANLSVYDGLYLALAEALEAPLLTGDAALSGVPGAKATVEVLATSS